MTLCAVCVLDIIIRPPLAPSVHSGHFAIFYTLLIRVITDNYLPYLLQKHFDYFAETFSIDQKLLSQPKVYSNFPNTVELGDKELFGHHNIVP